ncbi:MAG: amino acid permease [Planctomycetaceae bacterium]|nr:amino acid permease [Planctomycetaceae bacterium]
MSTGLSGSSNPTPGLGDRVRRPIQVIVVSSVMFTFISYWRTAAVVLADLASTAYYIGGIVEGAIGPAAPWFILAVMLFSYAVRSVYIESCSLFVRGGVYRVVKEAMGGFLAKLSVSALMFDYALTGPISAASAGQYVMGLALEALALINPALQVDAATAEHIRRWGSMVIACAITIYFFRQNLLGIHESSGKALKIVGITTVVAAILLGWCFVTLAVRGPANRVPWKPDLSPKVEYETVMAKDPATGLIQEVWKLGPDGQPLVKTYTDAQGHLRPVQKINEATGRQENPVGFIRDLWPGLARQLRAPDSWINIVGLLGLLIAFSHSILGMSGLETLAQVYREVESPKLPNFKRAAIIVFFYSVALTTAVSFLAVLLIPNDVRMKLYSDNLIGGLAMSVIGPPVARLLLNAAVVMAGFLILSGAVNTAIIGSNGVLNRVAEDGVMPDWFLKPHRRFGTTYRVLYLIVGMQLAVILLSRGNMYILGEAYAFGIIWSFCFKTMAMVVLRFKDRSPREYKVPLNIRIRGIEVPIGLMLIFLILLFAAVLNTLTKEVATIGGSIFTVIFLVTFIASEQFHERRRGAAAHKHIEQFNQRSIEQITPQLLSLEKPYRKLVAIRSTQNLFMLERALAETDPETTDMAVMTAQVAGRGDSSQSGPDLDEYNRRLMTAVVERAEKAGKHVLPLILRTNSPLFAIVQTARELQVQELVLGASNIHTADAQMEQIAFYWIDIHGGEPAPLTVRILSRSRDLYFDIAGGNRIPKIGERQARSVAELRSAGVGVDHVLLVHDDTLSSSDLFAAAITMIDPEVALTVAHVPAVSVPPSGSDRLQQDLKRAEQLHREIEVRELPAGDPTDQLAALAREVGCDLLILRRGSDASESGPSPIDCQAIARKSPCAVCVVEAPSIPDEVDR